MSRATNKVVTFTLTKGGVGKTTSALLCAYALAEMGKSVLAIDMDYQGSLSAPLTEDPEINMKPGGSALLFDVLEKLQNGEEPELLRGVATPRGIDILHGHLGLTHFDKIDAANTLPLRDYLHRLDYDVIIIDTPAALNARQIGPILWADLLVAPVVPEPLGVQGFNGLRPVIARLSEDDMNPGLKWKAFINNYDPRFSVHQKNATVLQATHGDDLISTIYRRSASIPNVIQFMMPIWEMQEAPKEVREAWRALPSHLGIV